MSEESECIAPEDFYPTIRLFLLDIQHLAEEGLWREFYRQIRLFDKFCNAHKVELKLEQTKPLFPC